MHLKRNQFFNILKVQHFKDTIPKFTPYLKKIDDVITLSKMVFESRGHVAWWRSAVDKTTRRVLSIQNLHLPPKHQYSRCRLKIQRRHSVQNRSTCCLASETLSSNPFCRQHYVARWNYAINSSQSPDYFSIKMRRFQCQNRHFASYARRRVYAVIFVNRL